MFSFIKIIKIVQLVLDAYSLKKKVKLLLKGSIKKVFIENIPKLGNLKLELMKVIESYNLFSIFVNNIDKNTKEIDLIKYFEIYGNIKYVKIIENKTN